MPDEFVRTAIKAVSLSGDIKLNTALDILSMCKCTQNLSLLPDCDGYSANVASLLQVMDTLPLRVLSFQVDVCLTSSLITDTTLFGKLTHLEIDICRLFEDLDLQYVPQLTHIAMSCTISPPEKKAPSLIRRLLDHGQLQVLIIRVHYHRAFAEFLNQHALHDRRIVVATTKVYMWDDLGRAAMLLWDVADSLVMLPEPNHSASMLLHYYATTDRLSTFHRPASLSHEGNAHQWHQRFHWR
jgi:hypothetical protein